MSQGRANGKDYSVPLLLPFVTRRPIQPFSKWRNWRRRRNLQAAPQLNAHILWLEFFSAIGFHCKWLGG